ncbi:MAG: HNH endonuclease [Alphaproteobacteria bacterium]|nr:HNH endonuclease [Alphaproteobacteria bacterium]
MVDFSEWKSFLHRLGGEKVRRELVIPDREKPPGRPPELDPVTAKIRSEGIVDLSGDDLGDIEVIKDDLLSLGGRQIVLYIYQPRLTWPKFHLVDCTALKDMRKGGRFKRYVAHARPEEMFPIIPVIGGKEERRNLLPCEYCLGRLGLSRARKDIRNFSRAAFFAKYKGRFPDLPEPESDRHSQAVGGYGEDWDKISRRAREAANWTCDECGVNCGSCRRLLHTHHINGILAECGRDNLRALCALCHSEQPYHHRLHVNEEDRKDILRLRRKQGKGDP